MTPPTLRQSSETTTIARMELGKTRALGVLLPVLLVLLFCSTAAAKKADRIEPGPTVMSEAEKALQPDPTAGIEHGVILVEEAYRNEDLGEDMETTFHLRAKILSNEGRDLANIEITFESEGAELERWWGRTILPDGTVRELSRDELEQQSLVSSTDTDLQVMKAALPGVVAGCVIDYGYVLREPGYVPYDRIPLQRRWPIQKLHYRWQPFRYMQGAYRLVKAEKLNVKAGFQKNLFQIVAEDLPPVVDEPLMPPDHMVQAAVMLYYVPQGTDYESYWDDLSKLIEGIVQSSVGKKRSVNQALTEIGLPSADELDKQLRVAYDWIAANLTRTGLRTFEEIQQASDDEKSKRDVIRQLLETRQGSAFEVQEFLIGVARALGADANMVFVTDRTEILWDPQLRSWDQFGGTIVALRPKGAPDERAVLVDPGSGLAFGQIPWYLAGAQGLLVAKSGGRAIRLKTSHAKDNVAECRVEASFTEDNESLLIRWSENGRGQIGLDERRYIRRLAPDDRAERIDELCGVGPDTEVVSAEVMALEDLTRNLELQCEIEQFDTDLSGNVGKYHLAWNGPWVPPLPDLPDGRRQHPIVFDFPRIDLLNAEFTAPAGFVPTDPPQPTRVERKFGRYGLQISRTQSGYHIERAIALYDLVLPVAEYEDLRSFIEEVRQLDRTPLTFVRSGSR